MSESRVSRSGGPDTELGREARSLYYQVKDYSKKLSQQQERIERMASMRSVTADERLGENRRLRELDSLTKVALWNGRYHYEHNEAEYQEMALREAREARVMINNFELDPHDQAELIVWDRAGADPTRFS